MNGMGAENGGGVREKRCEVVSFPRFASETAIFRRSFLASHSIRYTFARHKRTPQPLLVQRFFYFLRKNVRFGTIWDDLERFCTIWNDLVRLTCYSGIQESSRGFSYFIFSFYPPGAAADFGGCLPCIKRGEGLHKMRREGLFRGLFNSLGKC